jgi:hypothetical protein
MGHIVSKLIVKVFGILYHSYSLRDNFIGICIGGFG